MPRPIPLATEQLLAEVDDGIAWVTLNNPKRHNAITNEMFAAFGEVADAVATSADVRVVVLKGAGEKAFASGADISGLANEEAAGTSGLNKLSALDQPVIAMIRGYCIGGGLMTALHADLRVACDTASFAIPAAKLGVGYPLDGMRRLVSLVGPGTAAEIVLTGDRFSAAEAATMGLVNRVVPCDELAPAVAAMAATVAAGAPLTHAASKASIRAACENTADESSEDEAALAAIRRCWKSADFAEGRAAFAERRAAMFEGR